MPHLTPTQERLVLLAANDANTKGVKCVSRETMVEAIRASKIERGSTGDDQKDLKEPSRGYFRGLQKKHPDLKVGLRVPQQKEVEKHKMSQPEVVGHMFTEVGALLADIEYPTAPKGVPAAPSSARASHDL